MALQIDMSGKTALVTGAGRGLGLAIAASFLEAGASVAVNDLQPEYVGKAVEELGRDDRVFSCPGDVGSVAGCRTVVGNAIEEFNGLDFLVNNAAVAPVTPVLELSEEQWDQTVNVALKGVFFCSQAALPALKRSKGAIVNVASEMGLRGGHDSAAYCAAKGGTVNLTRALALEAAPDVRVNCVCPGIMDTPLSVDTARILGVDYGEIGIEWAHRTQLGRMAAPAEVASIVVLLCSSAASFMTGAVVPVDGGSLAGPVGRPVDGASVDGSAGRISHSATNQRS